MLQTISWQTYFTVCAVLLVIYYSAVIFLYYRQDLALLLRHQIPVRKQEAYTSANQPTPLHTGNTIDALGSNLKDEVKAFAASAGTQYNKEELQYGLQLLLNKYTVLKNSDLQADITKTIINECENNCAIVLSDEEAGMLWNG